MWSTHSRRIDPISHLAKPFCQREAGAVGLSRIPMARNDLIHRRGISAGNGLERRHVPGLLISLLCDTTPNRLVFLRRRQHITSIGIARRSRWQRSHSTVRVRRSRPGNGSKPCSRFCAECSMRLSATGCDWLRRRPSTLVRGCSGLRHRNRKTGNDHHAANMPRSFIAAGTGTFDRCDRSGRRTLRHAGR